MGGSGDTYCNTVRRVHSWMPAYVKGGCMDVRVCVCTTWRRIRSHLVLRRQCGCPRPLAGSLPHKEVGETPAHQVSAARHRGRRRPLDHQAQLPDTQMTEQSSSLRGRRAVEAMPGVAETPAMRTATTIHSHMRRTPSARWRRRSPNAATRKHGEPSSAHSARRQVSSTATGGSNRPGIGS